MPAHPDPRPVLLKFPPPARRSRPRPRAVFRLGLDPVDYRRRLVVECEAPAAILAKIRVRVLKVVG